MSLASRKFQNVLIKPQQIVSFFKLIGDISSRSGYLTSDFFLRDRWVRGPEAGLDQFASALYYLALVAGLEIVEHHAALIAPRSSGPEFIPMGFEACVYNPFFDLRFRNPFPFELALQTQVSADQLAITLYAKEPPVHPTQLETEIIKTLPCGTENRSRKDPTFILGTAPKQGMNGCVLKVVRKVYENQEVIETQTLFERTLAPVHEIVWVE